MVRVAQVLRVERNGPGGHALLYIDGEMFPYATIDGFSVHPRKGELPGVTLTIAGWRVEVVDDSRSETERAGDAPAGLAASWH